MKVLSKVLVLLGLVCFQTGVQSHRLGILNSLLGGFSIFPTTNHQTTTSSTTTTTSSTTTTTTSTTTTRVPSHFSEAIDNVLLIFDELMPTATTSVDSYAFTSFAKSLQLFGLEFIDATRWSALSLPRELRLEMEVLVPRLELLGNLIDARMVFSESHSLSVDVKAISTFLDLNKLIASTSASIAAVLRQPTLSYYSDLEADSLALRKKDAMYHLPSSVEIELLVNLYSAVATELASFPISSPLGLMSLRPFGDLIEASTMVPLILLLISDAGVRGDSVQLFRAVLPFFVSLNVLLPVEEMTDEIVDAEWFAHLSSAVLPVLNEEHDLLFLLVEAANRDLSREEISIVWDNSLEDVLEASGAFSGGFSESLGQVVLDIQARAAYLRSPTTSAPTADPIDGTVVGSEVTTAAKPTRRTVSVGDGSGDIVLFSGVINFNRLVSIGVESLPTALLSGISVKSVGRYPILSLLSGGSRRGTNLKKVEFDDFE